MRKGARVRGRCHPYKRRPETPLRRRGAARSCRWTPLSPRERLNLMPSRRLSGERGRDAPRKAHLLGVPAEGLRAVSGVSEATCDSLAWWDAVWQERDAHHRNWNGGTYVGAYRPLSRAHAFGGDAFRPPRLISYQSCSCMHFLRGFCWGKHFLTSAGVPPAWGPPASLWRASH